LALAKAMTGDTQGAIQDFQVFIDWLNGDGSSYYDQESTAQYIKERKAFVEALKNGQNPFDPATIKILWDE
jgi:hypothetical protein